VGLFKRSEAVKANKIGAHPRYVDEDDAKDDLLVPLEVDDDPWVDGLAGLNARAQAWCGEVNGRRHSEIHAIPMERLESELELLAELPSLRLEVGPKPTTRKVDKLSCIRFGSARYSVPNRLIGTTITVVVDERDRVLRVIEPVTGEVHAEHQLVARERAASSTPTTTAHAPTHRAAVRVRARRPSGSSSPWARSSSSSWSVLPPLESPSSTPRSGSCSPWVLPTATVLAIFCVSVNGHSPRRATVGPTLRGNLER